MLISDPDQMVLGPVFGLTALVGIISSFYLVLHTAQRPFNLGNAAVTLCAFSNLIGTLRDMLHRTTWQV